jgi:hypothetical protein
VGPGVAPRGCGTPSRKRGYATADSGGLGTPPAGYYGPAARVLAERPARSSAGAGSAGLGTEIATVERRGGETRLQTRRHASTAWLVAPIARRGRICAISALRPPRF